MSWSKIGILKFVTVKYSL